MRNKLKRCKNLKGTAWQDKYKAQIIVLSESSGSGDETSSENDSASLAAEDQYSSNLAAGFSKTQVQTLREERKTLSVTNIAPIFLRSVQHRKSRRGSDGELDQPVEARQKPGLPSQSGGDVKLVRSPPTASDVTVKDRFVLSTWRGQLSPSALHSCLEETQISNPAFPVQTVFSTLQKKASEGLRECGSTDLSPYPSFLRENHLKEKRKRGSETSERVLKRSRASPSAEGSAGVGHGHLLARDVQDNTVHSEKKHHRSSKLSRTHRLKQQTGSLENKLSCGWTNHTESEAQSVRSSDTLQRVSSVEDVLWTDKYSPQHSGDVVGNHASVKKLHRWLMKWKLRADCDERRKTVERKQEENSNDSWDCGDFQGEPGSEDAGDDPLCNTMLITGPSGVGKTASVYACAQELGFKVFEVNCSSQRSGRHVLSQLKEATQSHLVEMSGKDPLKPVYFNNYNTNSCTLKSETLPGKTALPKNVTCTAGKKRAARNSGSSGRKVKPKPAAVTLTHYFKMKAKADHLHFGGLSPSEKLDSSKLRNSSPGSDQTTTQNKMMATSLILFEEVDVIFEDDVGFLAAIKAFMATTKRPVVLTTSDPLFKERFDGSLEEIIFKTPSAVNVCSYLQLVCLAEKVRLDLDDARSLLRLTGGDVRRCLLQLQFWVHSGGGRWTSQSGRLPQQLICEQYSNATEEGDGADSRLPSCGTGCSADMLGLHSVTTKHLLNLLKCRPWSETSMNKLLVLLAGSWRGGVPLLYSNLELLLSVRTKEVSVHNLDKVTDCGLQSEASPSDSDLHVQQKNPNIGPKASVTNSKSVRNISRLSRRKHITTDTMPCTSLILKPQTSIALNRTPSTAVSLKDKTEQKAARVVMDCLDALADFFDLMSSLDATLPAAGLHVAGSGSSEAFIWTGAELKDGLLDETSEEEEEEESRSQSCDRLLDIQAAVEGLGCRRCWWRVSEAWTEAQTYRQELDGKSWERLMERLVLPASSKRQSLSFSFHPLCPLSVSQRRYKLSRMVLSSRSFSLLGNRQAVSVDYIPALRSICRTQQQKEEPASRTDLGLSKSTMRLLAEDFT